MQKDPLLVDSIAAEQRLRRYVEETPLHMSRWLSDIAGAKVFLKLENLQKTGSFKLRGAANKILQIPADQAARGIIAASNGNHAIAVSTIGRELGIPVDIFVSERIDPTRRANIEALGARVQTVPGDCLVAEVTARGAAYDSDLVYISPYNDVDVVAGQGTIAVEMLRQERVIDAVFVSVGGGGLIGGIGAHLKAAHPGALVVGCWPSNSPVLYECLRAGAIMDVAEEDTLSVSTTGGLECGSVTFPLAQRVIDRKVLVSEELILDSLVRLFREDQYVVEGAAGVAVAGFLKTAADYRGKTVVIVLCGGNADAALQARIRSA